MNDLLSHYQHHYYHHNVTSKKEAIWLIRKLSVKKISINFKQALIFNIHLKYLSTHNNITFSYLHASIPKPVNTDSHYRLFLFYHT